MWAGGHLTFSHPIHVEEPLRRTSTIAGVTPKSGGSGPLIFVRIDHEIAGRDGAAIREQQDIVYRDHPLPGQPAAKGGRAPKYDHRVEWRPDPIAMFRYSAITFNAHRIHYDRDYAVGVEGYRGLVVPGPMIATVLLDALVRHVPKRVTSFNYRSVSPLFDGDTVHLCAKAADAEGLFELWALDRDGSVAMQAEAQVRS
jgi:3-methylfumaryl-CoA hydratase